MIVIVEAIVIPVKKWQEDTRESSVGQERTDLNVVANFVETFADYVCLRNITKRKTGKINARNAMLHPKMEDAANVQLGARDVKRDVKREGKADAKTDAKTDAIKEKKAVRVVVVALSMLANLVTEDENSAYTNCTFFEWKKNER